MRRGNPWGNKAAYASYRLLIFYKSEISVLWSDLGTKYFRLKRKGHTHETTTTITADTQANL